MNLRRRDPGVRSGSANAGGKRPLAPTAERAIFALSRRQRSSHSVLRAHRFVSASCTGWITLEAINDWSLAGLKEKLTKAGAKSVTLESPARGKTRRVCSRLLEDLPSADFLVDLAMEAVIGVMLQVLAPIREAQLSREDREPAVGAVLGAIGVGKQRAAAALGKLRRANAALVERAPAA